MLVKSGLTHGQPTGSTAIELVVVGLVVALVCMHMTCRCKRDFGWVICTADSTSCDHSVCPSLPACRDMLAGMSVGVCGA